MAFCGQENKVDRLIAKILVYMRRHEAEIGKHYDNRITESDLRDATIQTLGDVLLSRFKETGWEQRISEPEGKFIKSATLTLSRGTLAMQDTTGSIQSALWPTVRNTRFLVDRLPRVKVDFSKLNIPNDGAFVSDALPRVENDDIAEQDIDLNAEQEVTLRPISAFKTVTDESFEDYGGLKGMFLKSLLQSVLMQIDAQIIAGDGASPNVLGIRNWTGIGSQSKSSDTTLVAVAKAAEKVYQAGYTPNLILMNPADWLAAVTTAAVDPFAVGNKLLGIDVFVTESSPTGLPTVLDTNGVYFLERSPLILMMSKTNDDDFVMGHCTFRAVQTCAVAVTDVAAVAKVVA